MPIPAYVATPLALFLAILRFFMPSNSSFTQSNIIAASRQLSSGCRHAYSLHFVPLIAGIRPIKIVYNKPLSVQAPTLLIIHYFCTSHCFARKKTPTPQPMLQNRCFVVRDQGLEPWTPWLRVRCSTNWANRAKRLWYNTNTSFFCQVFSLKNSF